MTKVSGCGLVEGNFSLQYIPFSEVMRYCPKRAFSLAKHTKLLMPDGAQQHIIRGCQGHAWHDKGVSELCINARGGTTMDYTRMLGAHMT